MSTRVPQGEEGIDGEKGMRGPRGQEVLHHPSAEPHFDGLVALHPKVCNNKSSSLTQGDRGPKGLKGLIGASGHKVKTALA